MPVDHRRHELIDGGPRALGDDPQQAVALDQVAGRQPMLSGEARPRLFGGIGFRPTHLLALRRTLGGESGGDRRDPAGADVHTDGVRIQPSAVEGVGEQAGNLTLGLAAGDRRADPHNRSRSEGQAPCSSTSRYIAATA